ncbi:hypothetical protein [Halomarina litorea]|uniref:hypothetical protein n=1 Tax=Halomarina litorea TaxID=2961595 RepID=UPI0020C3D82A|nr:hypothetical protein [Halomarina sp. BCD28]
MRSSLTSRGAFLLIALTGIVVPGVIDFFLVQYGYSGVGSVVWAIGYGSAVIAIWYGWFRPIDFTGDTGESQTWTADIDETEATEKRHTVVDEDVDK